MQGTRVRSLVRGPRILHSLLSDQKQKDQVVTMYPVSIQETLMLEGSLAWDLGVPVVYSLEQSSACSGLPLTSQAHSPHPVLSLLCRASWFPCPSHTEGITASFLFLYSPSHMHQQTQSSPVFPTYLAAPFLLLFKMFCFSKELKTELPYDPTIPLLGIYPKKMKH